ncbi:hypothetical protein PMM47T1_01265 [Pseudomonas sp. M47T1]|uniref:hypothetical protein n=1 Tax=Pseudomonas sp. M47T1 TaxID=1179778 RepID=UPI0002607F5A|nr:hypothetical protein [Pseudomonas sp. M47T1]EIK98625.1 hypothetical protein PMM47T1_01265 [Pseudomonas sp. M47T1]
MLINDETSITRRLSEFEKLSLPDTASSGFGTRAIIPESEENYLPNESERRGVVAGNAINTFEGELSLANERDLNNMGRYAEACANRKCGKETDMRAWYAEYTRVMSILGLGLQSYGFEELGTSDTSVKVDATALRLLGGAALGAGSAGKILVASIKDALASIKDDQQALGLFEKQSSSKTGANFQMMPAAQRTNGSCVVLLSCSYYKSTLNRGKVLFVSWNKSRINIFGSAQRTLFIREDYDDEMRTEVVRWLKKNAKNQFASIKLPDEETE